MTRTSEGRSERPGLGSTAHRLGTANRDTMEQSQRPLRLLRSSGGPRPDVLIEGSNKTCIATLVERHTRYVLLARLDNKKTETVVDALIKQAHKLPDELYKSLTWDRGSEMTGHQRFTLA